MNIYQRLENFEVYCFLREFEAAGNFLENLELQAERPLFLTVFSALLLVREGRFTEARDLLKPICLGFSTAGDQQSLIADDGRYEEKALAVMLYAKIIVFDEDTEAIRLADYTERDLHRQLGNVEDSDGMNLIRIEAETSYLEIHSRVLELREMDLAEREKRREMFWKRTTDLRTFVIKHGGSALLARIIAIPTLGLSSSICETEAWFKDSLNDLDSLLTGEVDAKAGVPSRIPSKLVRLLDGLTRVDLAEEYLRAGEDSYIEPAKVQLDLANSTFSQYDWEYGSLRVRKAMVSLAQATNLKPVETVYSDLVDLASNFKLRRCNGDYLRCLIDQILVANTSSSCFRECSALFERTREHIEQYLGGQRFFTLHLLQMQIGGVLTGQFIGDSDLLRVCEKSLRSLEKKKGGLATTALEAHTYSSLAFCYHRLLCRKEATSCCKKARDLYIRLPQHKKLASDAANLHAASLLTADVREARDLWMEWQDFDEQHGLLSNRQWKLVQLVMSYRQVLMPDDDGGERRAICEELLRKFRREYPLLNASKGLFDEVDLEYGESLSDKRREVQLLLKILATREGAKQEEDLRSALIHLRLARTQLEVSEMLSASVPPSLYFASYVSQPWALFISIFIYLRDVYVAWFLWPLEIRQLQLGAWLNTLKSLDLLTKLRIVNLERAIEDVLRLLCLRSRLLKAGHVTAEYQARITIDAQKWLHQALEWLDEVHDNFNHTGDLETLRRKINLEQDTSKKLYAEGVNFYLARGDLMEAWNWVQKSKSRSLSELISITCQSPANILASLNSDEDVLMLIKKESDLLAESVAGDFNSVQQLAEVRKIMKRHPKLSAVLTLRNGQIRDSISNERSWLKDALGEPLVDSAVELSPDSPGESSYVDWFLDPFDDPGSIYCFCRTGKQVHCRKLSITTSAVQKWMGSYLEFGTGVDGSNVHEKSKLNSYVTKNGVDMFQNLEPLVAPLEEWTSPNSLLVLSPSGFLHRLPLHAVKCGKTRLTDRNPIVYATALSIHRQCTLRVLSKRHNAPVRTAGSSPAVFLGTLSGAIGGEKSEEEAVATCLQNGADRFPDDREKGSEVLLDCAVTRERFESVCTESDWIHLHSHAQYDEKDIFKQGFALGPPLRPSRIAGGDTSACLEHEIFNVSDLFKLQMHNRAPHFMAISCQSTLQHYHPGRDDPLGIVSALLLAGAASTIGCLWPISSRAGREFTTIFYSYLKEQVEESAGTQSTSGILLDLAKGLRNTVQEMKNGEFHQPIHWAPFVLHGSRFAYIPK